MTLSICSGNAPSSTRRFISTLNGPRLRFATKPSVLPASALTLPILRPSAIAVAMTSGALLHLLGAEAAALDAGLVIRADPLHAAIQRLLGGVGDLHGIAVIGKTHRDPAAHRAGADNRGGVGRP